MGVHVALQDERTFCPKTKLFSSSIQLQLLHVSVLITVPTHPISLRYSINTD